VLEGSPRQIDNEGQRGGIVSEFLQALLTSIFGTWLSSQKSGQLYAVAFGHFFSLVFGIL